MFAFVISLGVLLIGFLICAGSIVALLRQKVVVDEAGHVSQIEIPLLGKLKTNYPSLIGIAIGAVLSYAVLGQWAAAPETLPLKAGITLIDEADRSSSKRDVFIGVALPNHYRFEQVLPNDLHEVEFPIILPAGSIGGHFAVAYTVIGIDASGYAERIVQAGNIRRNRDSGFAEFQAELRLPTILVKEEKP